MSFVVRAAQDGVAELSDLEAVFGNVVSAVLGLAGIVLFILLITGGIKYISSGGDPKGMEEAKKTITYAILGFVFIAAGYLILLLIKNLTGVDVTDFIIKQN